MQICMYLHVHITYTIHLFNLRIRNVLLINLSNSFLFIHLIEIYYEIILISFFTQLSIGLSFGIFAKNNDYIELYYIY